MRSSSVVPARARYPTRAKRARSSTDANPALQPDQLGGMPPGTVVTVLTVRSPAWPAVVLGYAEALRVVPKTGEATRDKLRLMRQSGAASGVAVRYFGDNSIGLVSQGMANAFVPGPPRSLSWQWDATRLEGTARRWPASVYEPSKRAEWEAAVVQASAFCYASWTTRTGNPLFENFPAQTAAQLIPGTLVWGLTANSPFWPGRICSDAEATRAGLEHDDKERISDLRPVSFIGPSAGIAIMSIADLSHFIPGPTWRRWMRARSERERIDREWPPFSSSEWDDWAAACDDAERLFRQLSFKRPAPPAFSTPSSTRNPAKRDRTTEPLSHKDPSPTASSHLFPSSASSLSENDDDDEDSYEEVTYDSDL